MPFSPLSTIGILPWFSHDLDRKSQIFEYSTAPCYAENHINEIHIEKHIKDVESDSQTILRLYTEAAAANLLNGVTSGSFSNTNADLSSSNLLRDAFKSLHGRYAFIIYDGLRRRIVAGRDLAAEEPLFWGLGRKSNTLLFSSDKFALLKHGMAVSEFPRGGIFISRPGQLIGTLNGRKYDTTLGMMHPDFHPKPRIRDSAEFYRHDPDELALPQRSYSVISTPVTSRPGAVPRRGAPERRNSAIELHANKAREGMAPSPFGKASSSTTRRSVELLS